jgi:hypothetical protein
VCSTWLLQSVRLGPDLAALGSIHLQKRDPLRFKGDKDVTVCLGAARLERGQVVAHGIPQGRAAFSGVDHRGVSFHDETVHVGRLGHLPVHHQFGVLAKV